MRSKSKGLILICIVGVLIIAGGVMVWFGARGMKTAEQSGTEEAGSQGKYDPLNPSGPEQIRRQQGLPPKGVMLTNWDQKVSEVLRDSADPATKGKSLLALFPQIPARGQPEAAQHIVNLVSDQDYPQVGRYFTNAATSPEVLDVFMADLMKRPNAVKLPLLLEASLNPKHPKAEEAKGIVKMYLEQDYGDNPDVWRLKMAEWLRKNPN